MRLIMVHVKPGSRAPSVQADGGRFVIAVREPAREGKANNAARRALAEHLKVPVSRIRLVRGATARTKTFAIDDLE
jgi:uncharacterized protein YggU (UPF0235/DUF167 family)